jgi:hypothetical protein
MEHGIDLEYSIKHFEKEIKYINELLRYMKLEHAVGRKLVNKRTNYEKCLNVLLGHKEIDYDPEVPLTSLRAKLYQLNQQLEVIPEAQVIIDQIEYVTKLLKDGKS